MAHYYQVTVRGRFIYEYADRPRGQDSYYASISPRLKVDGDVVADSVGVASCWRQSWSAMGGNAYYSAPSQSVWYVRLGPGAHTMQVEGTAWSDGTMRKGYLEHPGIEIIRMH